MTRRRTLDAVRALVEEGAILECVENTKRPELNGTRREVTRAGKSFFIFDYEPLDGGETVKGGYTQLPDRAGDVLDLTDDTVKWVMGVDHHGVTHTLTLRRVSEESGR